MFGLGNENDINKHAQSRSQIRPLTLLFVVVAAIVAYYAAGGGVGWNLQARTDHASNVCERECVCVFVQNA